MTTDQRLAALALALLLVGLVVALVGDLVERHRRACGRALAVDIGLALILIGGLLIVAACPP